MNRLAEFVHAEYGASGVRAFAYHPGGVRTKMALKMPEEYHEVLE